MIDLSRMRGAEVDPQRRTARVRGGSLLAELDDAAQAHGLVCPVGVVSHTGVAGLTLGGGMGRLQRKLGLTIDSLLAVELVTADGRVVRASEDENPELFWGMRGAGANFGIVTSFEFQLHPFEGLVTHGTVTHPIERAEELAERYRELVEDGPDELWTSFGMGVGGDARGPVASVSVLHSGSPADAERDLAGLRALDDPLEDSVESKPYLASQRLFDAPMEWGQRFSMKSSFLASLPETLVRDWADHVSRIPDGAEGGFSVWAWGRAIAAVPEDDTAFTGRGAAFWAGAEIAWNDAALDEACRSWARAAADTASPYAACRALRQRRHRGRRQRCAHDLRGREVRPARGAQAQVGPGQRLPAQPEHQAVATAVSAAGVAALPAFGERVAELAAGGLALLHLARIRDRDGGQERLRVGVLGSRVDLLGRADLDELAAVHDGDAVAHRADDGEVVRDEQVGEPEVVLQVLQQVEDLRLDRDVERGDRLVADDQLRVSARARAMPIRWRCPPENSCG